jgi:hypothetical protein
MEGMVHEQGADLYRNLMRSMANVERVARDRL